MNNFYSASTGGFYSQELHGANMPADAVAISAELYAQVVSNRPPGKIVAPGAGGLPALIDLPVAVPQSVTPLQARRALLQAGLLPSVETAIAAADAETRMAWEYATSVERNSPFVATLAAALSLDDAELDQLFILAAGFTA